MPTCTARAAIRARRINWPRASSRGRMHAMRRFIYYRGRLGRGGGPTQALTRGRHLFMIVRRSLTRALVLASTAGAVLVGGSQWLGSVSDATPLNQAALTVQAGDYFFAAPDTVESGYVTLDFSNAGTEVHHAQLVRLPDDLSIDQFGAALQGDERAALGLVKQAGGAAAIEPGWSDE